MSGAYIWRAALIAAIVNAALNPTVTLIGSRGIHFVSVFLFTLDLVLSSIAVASFVSVFGARRLRHELESGHRTPHGGTEWERHLLERLPRRPWEFGVLLGSTVALVAAVVLTVLGLLGFTGFAFGTFGTFMAVYTAALAFVAMRWTIVRQLMTTALVA